MESASEHPDMTRELPANPIGSAVRSMRQHIEKGFMSADVEHRPFPHIMIENFFPADVYAEILNSNPFRVNQGREWLPRDQSSNVSANTPYFARKQLDLGGTESFVNSHGTSLVWSQIRDCFLADHWFEHLAMEKYKAYFSIRFGELIYDMSQDS